MQILLYYNEAANTAFWPTVILNGLIWIVLIVCLIIKATKMEE